MQNVFNPLWKHHLKKSVFIFNMSITGEQRDILCYFLTLEIIHKGLEKQKRKENTLILSLKTEQIIEQNVYFLVTIKLLMFVFWCVQAFTWNFNK